MNFSYSETAGSGSGQSGYSWGDPSPGPHLTVIVNRWHTFTRPGTTLVTLLSGNWATNLDAVDDGYGNLIVLDTFKEYHRTSPRDD